LWCKQCIKDYRTANKERLQERARDYRARNKEEVERKKREYYLAHQEERIRKQSEYRKANTKLISRRRRSKYVSHKKVILERNAEYRKTPAGRLAASRVWHKRRYSEMTTECSLTLEQWQRIIKLQNNRCVICGKLFTKKEPPTKDHIIPVIPYNGPFTRENTQAVHSSCNSRKGNRLDKSNIVVWITPIRQVV
jgi:5-methylcytosine-specific restriction endonuclease McrA